MKTIAILLAAFMLLIVVWAVATFNATLSLAERDKIPDEEPILSANVTSIEHYPQEESYIYALQEREIEELVEIFSRQETKKSFFTNALLGEYTLTLHTSKKVHHIEINQQELYIEDANRSYKLESGELYSFIAALNQ